VSLGNNCDQTTVQPVAVECSLASSFPPNACQACFCKPAGNSRRDVCPIMRRDASRHPARPLFVCPFGPPRSHPCSWPPCAAFQKARRVFLRRCFLRQRGTCNVPCVLALRRPPWKPLPLATKKCERPVDFPPLIWRGYRALPPANLSVYGPQR